MGGRLAREWVYTCIFQHRLSKLVSGLICKGEQTFQRTCVRAYAIIYVRTIFSSPCVHIASFPGPIQLIVACSTNKQEWEQLFTLQAMISWWGLETKLVYTIMSKTYTCTYTILQTHTQMAAYACDTP